MLLFSMTPYLKFPVATGPSSEAPLPSAVWISILHVCKMILSAPPLAHATTRPYTGRVQDIRSTILTVHFLYIVTDQCPNNIISLSILREFSLYLSLSPPPLSLSLFCEHYPCFNRGMVRRWQEMEHCCTARQNRERKQGEDPGGAAYQS